MFVSKRCEELIHREELKTTLPTVDMMFVVRRLQELARKKESFLYLCFIDLTEAYDSVDRTLLWDVFACFGVLSRMLAVIRQFHHDIKACMQLDDGQCSDKFDVVQGLGQRCVLAPLLFNMFYTALLRVANKRSFADAAITGNMVQLQRKKEGEKKGTSRKCKVDGDGMGRRAGEMQRWWGMRNVDDAGIVSRSSE